MSDHEKEEKDEKRCERTEEPRKAPLRITPLGRKIGESPDNLQQRSDWFRRRTGGS